MSLVSEPADTPSAGSACDEVFGIKELRDMVLSNLSGDVLGEVRLVQPAWKQGCEFLATQADCGVSMNYPFSPELEEYFKAVSLLPSKRKTESFSRTAFPWRPN
jgi:hypothetical protein